MKPLQWVAAFGFFFGAAAIAVAGGGLGSGGFQPPGVGGGSVSLNGTAISPSSVTTAFVDAGIVATPEIDLRVGGAMSLKEGTGGQAGALILKAPIGVATTGGSGVGDLNVQGDFYVGSGLPFSVTYSGGNVTAGAIHSTSTKTTGCLNLSTGSAAVTVASGANCTCGLSVGTVWPKCAVSTTTLTITGTGSDTVCYVCL